MSDSPLSSVLNDINRYTECPRRFLFADEESVNGLRGTSRDIFSLCVASLQPEIRRKLAVQQLIIDGFDDEQIWQELELFNELSLPVLTADVSRLTAIQHRIKVGVITDDQAANHAECSDSSANHAASSGLLANLNAEDGVSLSGSEADEGYSDSETSSGIGSSEPMAVNDDDDDDVDDANLQPEAPPYQSDSEEGDEEVRGSSDAPVRRARSAVDDKFFSLSEMEQFLESEDRRFERERAGVKEGSSVEESDEEVDLFTENCGQTRADRSEQRSKFMYVDFFDPPPAEQNDSITAKRKRRDSVEEDENGDEDEGDDEEENGEASESGDEEQERPTVKSNLDKRHERLRDYISRLEEENLSARPWQLRGESTAAARPRHALLDEPLEFDQTRRAPIVTADVTAALERIVCRRVIDAAWDDVQRQMKPVLDPYEFKQRAMLDQEKSKLSLAQVYEQEYQKQKDASEARPDDDMAVDLASSDKPDPNSEREQIKRQMSELFAKLDALSNFHFVPKKPSAEVKIVSKLPAISAEETIPVAASNMELLAPEEIKEKKRAPPMAKEERSSTDKKRERRKKKHRQSVRAAQRAEREGVAARTLLAAPGGTSERAAVSLSRRVAQQQVDIAAKHGRVTKVSKKANKKALKSSSSFFNQLQDQVTSDISRMASGKSKQKKAKVTASADFAKMRL